MDHPRTEPSVSSEVLEARLDADTQVFKMSGGVVYAASADCQVSFMPSADPVGRLLREAVKFRETICSSKPCSCSCHVWSRNGVPESKYHTLWSLVFSGHRASSSARVVCNTAGCEPSLRRNKYAGTVVLPRWILGRQIMLLLQHWPFFGPMITLRTHNVRDSESEVFNHALNGRLDRLQELLVAGAASLLDVNENGWTLLHLALENVNKALRAQTSSWLINMGADIMQEDYTQTSSYQVYWNEVLAGSSKNAFAPELLGLRPDFELLGLTALQSAIVEARPTQIIQELVCSVPRDEIDAPDSSGRTALMWSCILARSDCVKILLFKGANPDRKDNDGRPPLSHCLKREDLHSAQMLVEAGAYRRFQDSLGGYLLHCAVEECCSDQMLDYCLTLQQDIDLMTYSGRTAVQMVILQSEGAPEHCLRMLRWFLKHNTDITTGDFDGYTLPHYAIVFNSHACLRELLREDNVQVALDMHTRHGSWLHIAAVYADTITLHMLQEAQLDAPHDLRNNSGRTALDWANWWWDPRPANFHIWLEPFNDLFNDVRERDLLRSAQLIVDGQLDVSYPDEHDALAIPGAFPPDEENCI